MENIRIYAPGGATLLDVPVTSKATHQQELMKMDQIHLEWSSPEYVRLPLGAYVQFEGITYILGKPYDPDSRDLGKYDYAPDFVHEIMLLQRVPFLLHRDDGVECDWNYTGLIQDLKNTIKAAILAAIGRDYSIVIDEGVEGAISLSFSNVDIFSALNSIADGLKCEWWTEEQTSGQAGNAIIHFGPKCIHEHNEAETLELTAGQEVSYPSSNNKGEFYNRFYVFGSTRNIPQDYEGANANTIVNKRLTLDPTIHPQGYMDLPAFDINGNISETTAADPNGRPYLKENGSVGYYVVDQSVAEGVRTFTKVLQLDDIYPRADLKVAHVAKRVRYVRDQNDEKVELTPGTYATYSVYYVQFVNASGEVFDFNPTTYQPKSNPNGHILPNTTPGIHFNTGALTGREFDVFKYHESSPAIKNETDGQTVDFSAFGSGTLNAGIFELTYKEDNTIIIPNDGIEPKTNDEAVVFNIRMPQSYVQKGYRDLDQAALVQIYEATKDGNEYTVQGNNVYFAENEPDITLGRHVYFYTQGRKIDTRVVKLTRNLDRRFEVELSFGKAMTKGTIQSILTSVEVTQQSVVTTQLESRQSAKEAQKRAYEAQRELRNSIFDTDGYFKDGKIKPETIETLMLSVGAKSTDYMLEGVVFAPNNDGTTTANPNAVNIIQGTTAKLTHFGISEGEAKEWTLAKPASAYTTDEEGKAFADAQVYYLYARCASNGTSGTFVFSKEKYKYNQFVDTNKVYYFLVGILSSVIDGSRILNMTYGSTTINGEQIRTGILRANNDKVRINLNTGEIFSQDGIKFIPTGKTDETSIEGYLSTALGIYDYLANAMKLASAYGSTTIDGGLVLTSAMVLSNPLTKEVMAGINGVIDKAKDIVAWYGGAMRDRENLAEGQSAEGSATALFRRDGTGYLAGGNIHWDENGFIYADPTSFLVGVNGEGDAVQLALYFVKIEGEQTITGVKTFVDGIKIGNGLIEWDEEAQMYRFNGSMYATGDVVAYGVGKTEVQSVIDIIEEYLEEHGGGGGGGYEPPAGGIPKKDLASDVQTSLGKADTAIQSHQSLDVTRHSYNGNNESTDTSVSIKQDIFTLSNVNHLQWGTLPNALIDKSTLAFWNGRYQDGKSNLLYFANGEIDSVSARNSALAGYLPLGGGVMTGALNLQKTESQQSWIYDKINNNSVITNLLWSETNSNNACAIRSALVFKWYTHEYQIGAIRGASTNCDGWGITKGNNDLLFQIGSNGSAYIKSSIVARKDLYAGIQQGAGGAIYVDGCKKIGASVNYNNVTYIYGDSIVLNNNADNATLFRLHASTLDLANNCCNNPFQFNKGLKAYNICIECDNTGANYSARSSEINNYTAPLYLQHNTSNNLYACVGGGNVGIGTSSPSAKLDVNGRIKTTASTSTTGGGGLDIGNCQILQLADSLIVESTDIRFGAKNVWDWSKWAGLKYDSSSKKIYLGIADGSIFSTNPATNYQTGGIVQLVNCGLVASGDVTAYSDARLKSDIKDLEYRGPLEPKTYIKDGKQCIGFIAQEVRELYPELVLGEEKEEEYLSLNYGAITAVLSAENRELKKKVDSLEKRLAKLEELFSFSTSTIINENDVSIKLL